MTNELKPCPFCGGEASITASENGNGFFVGCLNDGCPVNPCSGDFLLDGVYDEEMRQAAVDEWNTRADVEQGAVPMTEENMREHGWVRERTCKEVLIDKHWRGCSACGYKWEFMYGIGKCKMPVFCPDCGAKVVE